VPAGGLPGRPVRPGNPGAGPAKSQDSVRARCARSVPTWVPSARPGGRGTRPRRAAGTPSAWRGGRARARCWRIGRGQEIRASGAACSRNNGSWPLDPARGHRTLQRPQAAVRCLIGPRAPCAGPFRARRPPARPSGQAGQSRRRAGQIL